MTRRARVLIASLSASLAVLSLPAGTVPAGPIGLAGHGAPVPTNDGGRTLASLPVGVRALASSALGSAQRRFAIARTHGTLVSRGGGLATIFGALGPVVRIGGQRLSLTLVGEGRAGAMLAVRHATPVATHNRVVYRRGAVSEWYRNGPLGLVEGFTVSRKPTGHRWLTLAVRASGRVAARRTGGRVVFARGTGAPLASYGELQARDAGGRPLQTMLALAGHTLLLRIDDRRAHYPLTIDPFLQQGGKLTGGISESGAGAFGRSVAVSADGSTALIGADLDIGGAAWVFTRTGGTWTQQGPKLTGGGETGSGEFGETVALSADGNTALIGGPNDNGDVGAAWVFTRTGGAWSQQGDKLTGGGETGAGAFGVSVALSADGNTALIGGFGDNGATGAAWLFTRSSGAWSQQGDKLTGVGESGTGLFGVSVALSADGNTALIGGPGDNTNLGAIWAFARNQHRTTPLQPFFVAQGGKLTPTDATPATDFGQSVALSADGATSLIGGPSDDSNAGAAWAFTRSGGT